MKVWTLGGLSWLSLSPALVMAQTLEHKGSHPTLHINPKWTQCSFQIDPSLTQQAWHQFAAEAGDVTYFRPLTDAKPMGRGKFELSVRQSNTAINDEDAAWNDTFVHPDSAHWLFEGNHLQFPGLSLRAGLTNKTDVGLYVTKSIGANYGFVGGQLQQNLVGGAGKDWAASARVSFVSIYGPDDLDFTVYGADVVASREYATPWKKAFVSPYAGVAASFSRAHEKTDAVSLTDENVLGAHATVGAVARISAARIAVEYDVARVNSLSFKVGFVK